MHNVQVKLMRLRVRIMVHFNARIKALFRTGFVQNRCPSELNYPLDFDGGKPAPYTIGSGYPNPLSSSCASLLIRYAHIPMSFHPRNYITSRNMISCSMFRYSQICILVNVNESDRQGIDRSRHRDRDGAAVKEVKYSLQHFALTFVIFQRHRGRSAERLRHQ